jgi:hypothetical protein
MQDELTVRLTLFSSSATCAMLASIISRILASNSALAIETSAKLLALAMTGREIFSVAIEVIWLAAHANPLPTLTAGFPFP